MAGIGATMPQRREPPVADAATLKAERPTIYYWLYYQCANTTAGCEHQWQRTHKQQIRVKIRVHLHPLPIRCDSYAKLLQFVSIISLASTHTRRICNINNGIFYGTQVRPSICFSTHLALRLLRTCCNSPVEEPHKLSGQTGYPSGAGTLYDGCNQFHRLGSIV